MARRHLYVRTEIEAPRGTWSIIIDTRVLKVQDFVARDDQWRHGLVGVASKIDDYYSSWYHFLSKTQPGRRKSGVSLARSQHCWDARSMVNDDGVRYHGYTLPTPSIEVSPEDAQTEVALKAPERPARATGAKKWDARVRPAMTVLFRPRVRFEA